MKAIDIIISLTTMGNTEGTGTFETPENKNEIKDFLMAWFGGDCDSLTYDFLKIKTNTTYLYSYDSHLYSLKGGIHQADVVIDIETECAESNDNVWTDKTTIYLYEIEE